MIDKTISPSQLAIYWKYIGLPTAYWHHNKIIPPIAAFTCTCEEGGFKKEEQEHYYDWLCKLDFKKKRNFRAIITSAPSDFSAMQATAHAVKEIIKRTPHIVNDVVFVNINELEIRPNMGWNDKALVVAYGVNTDSTQHKLQLAYGLMTICHGIPFILVAGGTNPVDFCVKYLRAYLDIPIYFRDTLHLKTSKQAAKVITV
jgi:hypothetical protein